LTIFPGQVGGGVFAVWPSTIVRGGAEPALPGHIAANETASRQARPSAAAARGTSRLVSLAFLGTI
jgi:hypothetical protein